MPTNPYQCHCGEMSGMLWHGVREFGDVIHRHGEPCTSKDGYLVNPTSCSCGAYGLISGVSRDVNAVRHRHPEDGPCYMLNSLKDSDDPINHPSHYRQYEGLEIIDLVEQMNFNRGNAVKYISRAGFKNPDTEVEDLKKAQWYITREIERLEQKGDGNSTEQ